MGEIVVKSSHTVLSEWLLVLWMKDTGHWYKHVVGKFDLMWRAVRRVSQGLLEEMTMI